MPGNFSGGSFSSGSFSVDQAVVAQSPGGSGRRYPMGNLDLATWQRNRKKLEAKIERVQQQIHEKRQQISHSLSYEQIERLKKQIATLQKQLLEALGALDMLKKQQDEAEELEIMAVYAAYRRSLQ